MKIYENHENLTDEKKKKRKKKKKKVETDIIEHPAIQNSDFVFCLVTSGLCASKIA